MSGFHRGDSGQSAGGEFTFKPTATTGVEAIPGACRYFKISGSTRLTVQLRNDLASTVIWAQAGTNIENVGWIYNSNAVSSLVLSFHG